MGLFKKLFFPLKSQFKKLDALMQNRVALSVTLAGFAQRAAENQLFPKILSVIGTSISSETKTKITTELAIGIIACVRIPDKTRLSDVWGLEAEALRQMVAMLVFSESADSRQVLDNARYSSNPDEARVQVLLAIARLVGSKDDTLITRINTQTFGNEWNGFATEFVDGAITGFKRSPRPAMIESVADRIDALSPRGQALIEEFINRCAAAPSKVQPIVRQAATMNSVLGELHATTQVLLEALRGGDLDKAHEAVSVLLMQGMTMLGAEHPAMKQFFPVWDAIQKHIAKGDSSSALGQADTWNRQLSEVMQIVRSQQR